MNDISTSAVGAAVRPAIAAVPGTQQENVVEGAPLMQRGGFAQVGPQRVVQGAHPASPATLPALPTGPDNASRLLALSSGMLRAFAHSSATDARTEELRHGLEDKHDIIKAVIDRDGTSAQLVDAITRVSRDQAFANGDELRFTRSMTKDEVIRTIATAVRTKNARLLDMLPSLVKRGPRAKVTLEMVCDALKIVGPQISGTVQPGSQAFDGNALFAFRVLAVCSLAIGDSAAPQIFEARRWLLRRTGVVCFAPYASLAPADNMQILMQQRGLSARNPHFLSLLDRFELPPDALARIAERTDLAAFPSTTLYGLVARCLHAPGVPDAALVRFVAAAVTCGDRLTTEQAEANAHTTFATLANRRASEQLGKDILRAIAERIGHHELNQVAFSNRVGVLRAATRCAAEGTLFRAEDAADTALQLGMRGLA